MKKILYPIFLFLSIVAAGQQSVSSTVSEGLGQYTSDSFKQAVMRDIETETPTTIVKLTFRNSRSGIKLYPHLSIEFSNDKSVKREEIEMKDFKTTKGVSISLPNGKLTLTINAEGYNSMVLPISIMDQGILEYSANLTPERESEKFSSRAFETLTMKDFAVIVGTLVDAETGLPVTEGHVETLDGKHESDLANDGYFRLTIPIADTHLGALDQNVSYVDLKFFALGYETRVIKNQPAWFHSVTSMEGTRINYGTGKYEIELDEIGSTSLYKAMHPNEGIGNNSDSIEKSRSFLSVNSFPWNNCIPQTIVVGFKNQALEQCCTGNCYYYAAYEMNEYIRHVIPAEWFPSWQSSYGSSVQQAYIAGVVAIRSYCIYKILISPSSPGYYHICSSACCQAFGATNQYTDQAVNANTTTVLTYNNSIANSEFSSENNHKLPECFNGQNTGCGCVDGQVRRVNPSGGCGSSCINDQVGTGKRLYGHGRGMSQYGSARWATGYDIPGPCSSGSNQPIFTTKTWQQIISQYYPNLTSINLSQCTFDCSNVTTLTCNSSVSGSTSGLSNNINTYGGYISLNETGPEKIYKIVTSQIGTISVTLSNVTYTSGNNLDVFLLKNNSCTNLNPIADQRGVTSGLSVIYQSAPAGTYYIIVDGVNSSSGSFTITVSAPCNLPNLTDYGSTKTSSGRSLTITAKVVNNGGANAPLFKTKFVLSTDIAFGNDYDIGILTYNNGLPAGYYSVYTFTWTAPNNVPSGYYYILEYIDYTFLVNESNENDNAWYLGNPIYLPPPSFAGDVLDRSSKVVSIIEINVNNGINKANIIETIDMPVPIYSDAISVSPANTIQAKCNVTMNGYSIVSSQVDQGSSYILFDILGRVICQGVATEGLIQCSVTVAGLYFFSVEDREGKRCLQKILVN